MQREHAKFALLQFECVIIVVVVDVSTEFKWINQQLILNWL